MVETSSAVIASLKLVKYVCISFPTSPSLFHPGPYPIATWIRIRVRGSLVDLALDCSSSWSMNRRGTKLQGLWRPRLKEAHPRISKHIASYFERCQARTDKLDVSLFIMDTIPGSIGCILAHVSHNLHVRAKNRLGLPMQLCRNKTIWKLQATVALEINSRDQRSFETYLTSSMLSWTLPMSWWHELSQQSNVHVIPRPISKV